MKFPKRVLMVMLAAVMVLALTACGNSGNSSSDKSGGNKKGVTLTFWNGFTASDGQILQSIVDKFNKTNKEGITIKMDVMAWNNFNQKLPTAITSKQAPDFVLMNAGDFASYVHNGALKPMGSFWNVDGVNKSDFNKNAINLTKVNGKQYFIPMQVQGMYLYWNKDLFKAAGVDPNSPPKTWQQLADLAPKLTNASKNVYGFAFPTDGSAPFYNWLLANGGSLANSDYTKSTFDSPQTLKTLKQIQKLVYTEKASPQSISGAEADNLFKAGQSAMYINGPWLNNGLQKAGLNYGITPLPAGPKGKTAILDGVGFAIPVSTPDSKTQAIYDFIKYWNSTAIGKEWSLKNDYVPYLKSVASDPKIKNNPVVNQLAKQMDYAKPFMKGSTAMTTINTDVINPMLEKLFNGADVNKLMKDTSDQINHALSSQ